MLEKDRNTRPSSAKAVTKNAPFLKVAGECADMYVRDRQRARESLSCMVSLKVGWFVLLFVLVLLQGRFAVCNFLLAAVVTSLFIFR